MKTPVKEIDGVLWPLEWSLRQCPYAKPGVSCAVGGSPCPLPWVKKLPMLQGPAECEQMMEEKG